METAPRIARYMGGSTVKDLPTLITEANQARRRVLDLVRCFTPEQGAFKPAPAVWSIAEIMEHLVIAEQGCINRVWAAADGLRRGHRVWTGEPIHRGRSIEEVVALTWAPRQEAPEIARPRRGGPLSYWIVALTCNQSLLEALPATLEGLDLIEIITPHPVSGPLDARQWLAFVRFHLDRHRAQIQAVTRAPGYPTA